MPIIGDFRSFKSVIISCFRYLAIGNNPMVGMTVACAVAVEEASK